MAPLLPLLKAIRRPTLWLLMLAVMVYGPSATLVGILGPTHVHVSSSGPQALPQPIAEVFRAVRAWRAELRHRLLPPHHAHAVQGHDSSAHAHAHAHAAHGPTADTEPVQGATAHADSSHAHDAWQRHHHAPQDHSVLALDDAAGPDAANPAASGSATLPLALSLAPALAAQPCAGEASAWGRAAAARWSDAPQHTVRPPPRA